MASVDVRPVPFRLDEVLLSSDEDDAVYAAIARISLVALDLEASLFERGQDHFFEYVGVAVSEIAELPSRLWD